MTCRCVASTFVRVGDGRTEAEWSYWSGKVVLKQNGRTEAECRTEAEYEFLPTIIDELYYFEQG